MRKVTFFALILGMTTLTLLSCGNKKNIVTDIEPMETDDLQWRTSLIDSLRNLPAEERTEFLTQNVPELNSKLVIYLKRKGYGCEIKSLEYFFGSGKAKDVESGDGETYNGKYNEQLYAVVKGEECLGDSLIIFVQCLNGTFSIKGNAVSLGSYTPEFTIEQNRGINKYVDYITSIYLAEYHNIPIYRGKKIDRKFQITPDQARALQDSVDLIQVTALVHPGDHFNLGTMTYTRSGQ